MQYFENYVSYFRSLCENHPELQHSDNVGNVVFLVMSLFDFFGGAWREKLKEKKYAFVLLTPNATASGNNYKTNHGGFIVLHYHSERQNTTDMISAMTKSERVGFEIIQRMVKDSIEGHELFDYSFSSPEDLGLTIEPEINQGDTGYSGWMFFFEFQTAIPKCDHGTVWLDDSAPVIGDPEQSEIVGDDDDNIISG